MFCICLLLVLKKKMPNIYCTGTWKINTGTGTGFIILVFKFTIKIPVNSKILILETLILILRICPISSDRKP
jgi:hypothetical protein